MDPTAQLALGRLLLERGRLGAEDLQALLREQLASGRPLSELAVEKGYVTRDELAGLIQAGRTLPKDRRREDAMLAKVLARMKLVDDAPLQECLRSGDRLGELLIRKGLLSLDDLTRAMAALHRGLLECPQCRAACFVADFDSSRRYACRACKSALRPAYPDRVTSRLASTLSDVIRAETPEEVRKARQDPKRRFGKYVLLERLGKGGMGVVQRAWDLELNRPVAIKFVSVADPEEVARFVREARTAAKLSHPGIVAVHEVGSLDDRCFIAMELIRGTTPDRLNPGIRRAGELVRDAALAIQAAHDQGIMHRDLKPQNLMVREDGRVAVMDFGLARQVEGDSRLTQSGTIVGTPSYMSPEQASGSTTGVDARTDVYSLGATLYHLATGHPPFDGETPLDTIRKVVEEDPAPPSRRNPKVPARLENIVLKAMAKAKDRRYASASEFANDLDRFLRGEEVIARRTSAASRALRRVRRNPLPAIAAAALLLLLAAGAAWLAWRSGTAAEYDRLLLDGNARFAAGEYREALRLLSRADQIRPGAPGVRGRIAECERRIAQTEARARELEAAIAERERRLAEARPHFDRGARVLEDAGRDLYRPGADLNRTRERLAEAIAAFDEAIRVHPDHHDALFGRARGRLLRFEVDLAHADLSRAIELAPTFVSARVERGKLLIQRVIETKLDLGWVWDDDVAARFRPWEEQARLDFEAAAAGGAQEHRATFEALLAFVRERLDECVSLCRQSLADNADQEEVWKLLGDALHFKTGWVGFEATAAQRVLFEEAAAAYSRAIALRVNYYEARIMRANEHHHPGNPDAMRADVDAALAQRPEDPLGCWMKGQYFGTRDPAEALRWYERGLRAKPDSFANRVNRAVQLAQGGRNDEAAADVERALAANPAHYFPWYGSSQ
jgi:tetratricopeptide (TPR) repeat protein